MVGLHLVKRRRVLDLANHAGERPNKRHREMLSEDGILRASAPLVAAYATGHQTGEGFGYFVVRSGVVKAPRHGLDFHA